MQTSYVPVHSHLVAGASAGVVGGDAAGEVVDTGQAAEGVVDIPLYRAGKVGHALFAAEVVVGGGFGGGGQRVVIGIHGRGESAGLAAVEVVVGEGCHATFRIFLAGHVAIGIIPIDVLRTRGLIAPGIPDGRKGDAGEAAGVIVGVVGLAAELVAFPGLAAEGVVAGFGVGAATPTP